MTMLALQPQNLPTPIQEEWKYTNLPRALPQGLKAAPPEEKLIHRTRGQNGGEPVEILWTGRDGTLQAPVLKIVLEEGAELVLVERHDGQGSYWKNIAAEITLAEGAKLRHYRVQNDGPEGIQTAMVKIDMERGAVYEGFSLNLGGKLTRHEIHAVLNGPDAVCTFNGINLMKGVQHGDTTILIEHAAPRCQSNQFYRTILGDTARGVFQGKVYVHKVAQKTDGYQLSNAILLSDGAEMDTKPELEIYADDVKCSHGATTGQLDEEPLFYLRSRGLSDREARLLLVQAFVDDAVDKIVDESVKTEIAERAHAWLKSAL